jgi:hypothetical protein
LLAAAARVEAPAARTEAVRRARWPRLALAMDWSRSDLPAGVFASKLNSGAFAAGDFAIDQLNDPSALSHLGTTLALEVPIDAFGKLGAAADAMAAQGGATAASSRDAAHEIRLRVVEAYRQVETAGRAAQLTERVLQVARARQAEIEARVEAGAVRFRPMLLTAAAVVVGSFVMLFDPIFQGLAISMMMGEIAATLLSRLAVPVVYYLIARRGRAEALRGEGLALAASA